MNINAFLYLGFCFDVKGLLNLRPMQTLIYFILNFSQPATIKVQENSLTVKDILPLLIFHAWLNA